MTPEFTLNREYKDRLFRFLFSEPEAALSLYNAVNGSSHTDASALEFMTIEDVLYMDMKNDNAILIGMDLCLYEQQSSYNPNMPLRGLLYLARIYDAYIQTRRLNVYGTKLLKLPTPQYVVFYNGTRPTEAVSTLRLSDAFDHPDGCLELTVKQYNINPGLNPELEERCRDLRDYSLLVEKIRAHLRAGMKMREAVNRAVDECIREGVLKQFLLKHKAEVRGMLLSEFNMEEFLAITRRDEREEGRKEGREEGREEGEKKGREEGEEHATLNVMRNLVRNLGSTPDAVMELMGIPVDNRAALRAKLLAQEA